MEERKRFVIDTFKSEEGRKRLEAAMMEPLRRARVFHDDAGFLGVYQKMIDDTVEALKGEFSREDVMSFFRDFEGAHPELVPKMPT